MIIADNIFTNMLSSPTRHLRGRVEFYEGSTLALICGCHDSLISFTIERAGEQDKFFGFGICQKITVKLRDKDRKINITKNNTLEVAFGVGTDYIYPCPNFYVDKITRDENTNQLTIVAYDGLYIATEHLVNEIPLQSPYTIRQFATACAAVLHVPMANIPYEVFDTIYATGANFEGTENIRVAFDAVAEATQTVYYIDRDWNLTFKRLDATGEPVAVIDKSQYMTLKNKDTATLANITHATELGDNITATSGLVGATQYVRNNPFWDMREDIARIVEAALAAVSGLTITGFDCSWRGNFLLEIGDKISLITKDDNEIISYVLDDTLTFNGGLSAKMSWNYEANEAETASNPSTLGEAIKQTYARVDKAKKEIELVAQESSVNRQAISALQIDTRSINATVSSLKTTTDDALGAMDENITTLASKVAAQITAEDVRLQITNELSNGATKVATSTGFTFDDEGLTVEKTNSEMKTQITEDGMKVYRSGNEVLTANNQGVEAVNLRASTYLIVGTKSRFEDYGGRTGCFWIGG